MSKKENIDVNEDSNLIGEQQVLDAFNYLEMEKEGNRDAAWERFSQALAQKDQKERRLPRRIIYYSVAASFLALISISVFLFNQYTPTTYRATFGEMSKFYLPDSSILILNADSRVSFRKSGWNRKRMVSLKGEAFFDVRKGKDFLIETSEATVKVLGTSFNVYSRDGFFSVKCKTGEILVTSKVHRSTDTLKGREALEIPVIKNGGIKKYMLGNIEAAAWIKGEFYYNDVPLNEVIKELERQFNVEISASDDIQSRHYSGYFKNDQLVSALEYVCTPMNLKYQVNRGNSIRIY